MLKAAPAKDYDAVASLRDPITRQYMDNRELVLEALAALTANPNTAAAPAPAGAGGGAARLNVNKSLKPFTLLPTHNPTEFKHWQKLYRAYYRTSNMELLEHEDQQVYIQALSLIHI